MLAALGGHLLDLPEGLGLQQLEGQILQLPLEPSNPEAIGQGGIDLAGFPGDALAFLLAQGTEGAHVVQAVRQLHQHHADVAGHGQEHLAQVLRLGLGAVVEMNAAEFGDALHQGPHLHPEMLLDLLRGDVGVLDHVVEEAGSDHTGARSDVTEQVCHGHRMDDVRVTAGPELALVKLEAEVEGGHQKRFRIGRAALADARRHIADALTQPLRQGDAVVVGIADRMTAQLRQIASDELRTGERPGARRWRGGVGHPTQRVNPWYSVHSPASPLRIAPCPRRCWN